MYVGVTYTGNGPYRSEVPAVSSRSLDGSSLFQVLKAAPASWRYSTRLQTLPGTGPLHGCRLFQVLNVAQASARYLVHF